MKMLFCNCSIIPNPFCPDLRREHYLNVYIDICLFIRPIELSDSKYCLILKPYVHMVYVHALHLKQGFMLSLSS